ncbi:4-hydroxy-tetrahydrodipicolinate synthase [Pseudomonas sp. URMO17WK12:I4]|uniref:4-hydroxy-tetrahydrodipicolinate synthase n=1 Tax=Pseudomonas sp. URMO17WK12:I4 TaxID=1283292 RepID=UPI0004800E5C|nr:4-hydroxy-tetrahydrodipicolinate synthase [Pseudomonas sp. URMO17WK12:I4]
MIRGSIAAIVTPMNASGELDDEGLAKLVDFHLRQGTHGLLVAGTTGESATLDFHEHIGLIRRVVERVQGEIPVIAGTGSNSTREAIELSAAAKQAGADACLLITPYYLRPPQHGLYAHFEAIARAVDIPQILYNVPARTCCELSVETVARLSRIANIVGIKDATGDLQRVRLLVERCAPGFALYAGDDRSALDTMLLGAVGCMSVTANIAPRAMAEMYEAVCRGDVRTAMLLDKRLRALHTTLAIQTNPIPAKWLLHHMGLIGPSIRLPLTRLSDAHQPTVLDALSSLSVLAP